MSVHRQATGRCIIRPVGIGVVYPNEKENALWRMSGRTIYPKTIYRKPKKLNKRLQRQGTRISEKAGLVSRNATVNWPERRGWVTTFEADSSPEP